MPACISGLNKKPAFDRLREYSLRVQEHNRHLSGLQSTADTFSVISLSFGWSLYRISRFNPDSKAGTTLSK